VGLSDLGDAVSWGETIDLIEEAASDPSTALGAELAGWGYPASMIQLITMAGQVGKPAMKLMPWVMKNPRRAGAHASADEVAVAQAELEDGIVFSS
jgi:hypothetical protein